MKIVTLKPFEGEPEQKAEVLGEPENGCVMVRVLPEYREGKMDDGLREVPLDQIEESL